MTTNFESRRIVLSFRFKLNGCQNLLSQYDPLSSFLTFKSAELYFVVYPPIRVQLAQIILPTNPNLVEPALRTPPKKWSLTFLYTGYIIFFFLTTESKNYYNMDKSIQANKRADYCLMELIAWFNSSQNLQLIFWIYYSTHKHTAIHISFYAKYINVRNNILKFVL